MKKNTCVATSPITAHIILYRDSFAYNFAADLIAMQIFWG